MARYSVKIAEVHLISDKPITPERYKRMADLLSKEYDALLIDGDLEAVLTVSRPPGQR